MAGITDIVVQNRWRLPAELLSAQYSRSGGPGGQNVNKVASKVDLRLDLVGAEAFMEPLVLQRIRLRLANRIDSEGKLRVISSEHRDQIRNLDEAMLRMQRLLEEAVRVQKPRKATRPTRASKERRLTEKKQRSQRKQQRGSSGDE